MFLLIQPDNPEVHNSYFLCFCRDFAWEEDFLWFELLDLDSGMLWIAPLESTVTNMKCAQRKLTSHYSKHNCICDNM